MKQDMASKIWRSGLITGLSLGVIVTCLVVLAFWPETPV